MRNGSIVLSQRTIPRRGRARVISNGGIGIGGGMNPRRNSEACREAM
jgi:hypothetical protein